MRFAASVACVSGGMPCSVVKKVKVGPIGLTKQSSVNVTCCDSKRPDACCREARKHSGQHSPRGDLGIRPCRKESASVVAWCNVTWSSKTHFLPPNVSCDDTGLPARSSNWTPVTSPTRNSIAAHDVRDLDSSGNLPQLESRG